MGTALGICALLTLAPAAMARADDPAPPALSAAPSVAPSSSAPATDAPVDPSASTPADVTPPPVATPEPTPPVKPPKPPKQPRRKLPLRNGDFGPLISKAQQRLTWLGYEISPVTLQNWLFGDTTEAAVKKFQTKFWLKPTGVIDTATWKKLASIAGTLDKLPKSCTTASKAICADKTQKILRWVVKGQIKMTVDARFGLPGTPTGEGTFSVHQRDYDHTSTLYKTWMPRALFFNGGQAVHFSPYFQRDGYNGGSHGCIGIRDMEKATWLFNQVPMGTRVYVYWS